MISSFFVLIAGILIMIFDDDTWVDYIDPITSLIICALILITTVPLVRGCLHILLQSTPKHIDLKAIKTKIRNIDGVINTHDFHAWQLTDGMVISSLHVVCKHGCNFEEIAESIKVILHKAGIHSTAIQPEFVNDLHITSDSCLQNCVEDCAEDWCCKEPDTKKKGKKSKKEGHGHSHGDEHSGHGHSHGDESSGHGHSHGKGYQSMSHPDDHLL